MARVFMVASEGSRQAEWSPRKYCRERPLAKASARWSGGTPDSGAAFDQLIDGVRGRRVRVFTVELSFRSERPCAIVPASA